MDAFPNPLYLLCNWHHLQIWSSPSTVSNPFPTPQHSQDKVRMFTVAFEAISALCVMLTASGLSSVSPSPCLTFFIPLYCKHHILLFTSQPFHVLFLLPRMLFACPVFSTWLTSSPSSRQLRHPLQQEDLSGLPFTSSASFETPTNPGLPPQIVLITADRLWGRRLCHWILNPLKEGPGLSFQHYQVQGRHRGGCQ